MSRSMPCGIPTEYRGVPCGYLMAVALPHKTRTVTLKLTRQEVRGKASILEADDPASSCDEAACRGFREDQGTGREFDLMNKIPTKMMGYESPDDKKVPIQVGHWNALKLAL